MTWISVDDRLPEPGMINEVLVIDRLERRIANIDAESGTWQDSFVFETLHHVTHWQPLPEPPKEKE